MNIKKLIYLYSSSSSQRFTVSIIGRPNVGKSSIFNKLHAGRDTAIVSPEVGVTRDRKEGYSELFKVPVRIVDTPGIEDMQIKNQLLVLQDKMMIQTAKSLSYSDMTLFVIDARIGITSVDQAIAKWLRYQLEQNSEEIQEKNKSQDQFEMKQSVIQKALKSANNSSLKPHPYSNINASIKNVLLVANKCENEDVLPFDLNKSLYRLGLGDPIMIAAQDGTGLQDLISNINKLIPDSQIQDQQQIRLRRRQKFESIKTQLRKEILEFSQSNKASIDIADWERDFNLANHNPSDNSDFDEGSGVDYNNSVNNKIIQDEPGVSSENLYKNRSIQVSIIGRVNMGKSTLVNKLIEQDRVISDAQPGTTRDPISIQWNYKGHKVTLVDTAGIEATTNNTSALQKLVEQQTNYAIRYSNIVILLIDGLGAYRSIDLALAQRIAKEGRGIIAAVNKWDLVEKEYKPKVIKFLEGQLEKNLTEIQRCPIQCISAEKGLNLNGLMDNVVGVYDKWNTRISTGLLNDWLNKFKKLQNLPISDGDRLRIRFITQIKIRPPSFAIFINDSELFKLNYLRFLRQSISKEFGLYGVPIRFYIRDSKYKKERKILEKENVGVKVKQMFLHHRRLVRLAKSKLEQLDRARKNKSAP